MFFGPSFFWCSVRAACVFAVDSLGWTSLLLRCASPRKKDKARTNKTVKNAGIGKPRKFGKIRDF